MGPGEFVIVVPGVDETGAALLADRILEKVALWAILDRQTRKALKEAAKATATPVRSVDDAIKAVKDKDFDLAYDIASGLPERDKRFVESEIEAAQGVV